MTKPRTCSRCHLAALYPPEDRCRACNHPVADLAPNVQLANRTAERRSLQVRYRRAKRAAVVAGTIRLFGQLESIAKVSRAVVSVPAGFAYSFFKDGNPLYAPYHELIRGGVRAPADFESDRERTTVDHLLYGSAGEQVLYAALSPDGIGLDSYGPVHLELKPTTMAFRSTVLESNSFVFVRRRSVSFETPLPKGYLSTWKDRHKLVLCTRSEALPKCAAGDALKSLLLKNTGSRAQDEFFETHIFGTFNHQAVEQVRLSETKNATDRIVLRALRALFKKEGVKWSR